MSEDYYRCGKCQKMTKSVTVSFTELYTNMHADSKDTDKIAAYVFGPVTDWFNMTSLGLWKKMLGFAGKGYKCTECGYVRIIKSNGKEAG
jgi:DNA-directed RNA polymerase subunit RPC12/RpoP